MSKTRSIGPQCTGGCSADGRAQVRRNVCNCYQVTIERMQSILHETNGASFEDLRENYQVVAIAPVASMKSRIWCECGRKSMRAARSLWPAFDFRLAVLTGVCSVLVSYQHFRSSDGSFDARLPTGYIWGAALVIRTEQFHYEDFSVTQCSEDSRVVVVTLNPFVRRVNVWIRLFGADGLSREDGPFRIPGRGLHRWESAHALVETLASPVGVVARSDSKAASFVGSIAVPSGRMTDLEHMHPFFTV